MFYTYILRNKGINDFYIGFTEDLKRRVKQHQSSSPCKLIYYEAYLEEEQARERERKLKQYGSAWQALKKRIAE